MEKKTSFLAEVWYNTSKEKILVEIAYVAGKMSRWN